MAPIEYSPRDKVEDGSVLINESSRHKASNYFSMFNEGRGFSG